MSSQQFLISPVPLFNKILVLHILVGKLFVFFFSLQSHFGLVSFHFCPFPAPNQCPARKMATDPEKTAVQTIAAFVNYGCM